MARSIIKALKKYLPLALGVWATTQAIGYWVQVQSVDKTLNTQLMVYQQRGEDAYREAVLANLRVLGLKVREDAFTTVEDHPVDEFRAELHYRWPWHVLAFTFDRPNIARARTVILDR